VARSSSVLMEVVATMVEVGGVKLLIVSPFFFLHHGAKRIE
jgi:hypothetical protein